MKKLVKFMSPFAPDQSGACGVLYEFGGLTVICDAGGCAGNICGFDEPRWFTYRSAVFSAGLRDMDAILGRDDRLIAKLTKAQEQLHTEFTAIIGTPVPAVIATDYRALSRMAEKKTGVPCITVDCTGTHYYDAGEKKAWTELFRRFAVEDFGAESGRVGILGATPLETSMSGSEKIVSDCYRMGIEKPIVYGMGFGLDYVREASRAEKNLVISLSALPAAEYLRERFGTPFEVGFPFLPEDIKERARSLKDRKVLIIHSQLIANTLRDEIGDDSAVTAASWFGVDERYSRSGDVHLADEDALAELISSGGFDTVISDGAVGRLLHSVGFGGELIELPHFAVSGQLWESGEAP